MSVSPATAKPTLRADSESDGDWRYSGLIFSVELISSVSQR
jgi:hypothetical protein